MGSFSPGAILLWSLSSQGAQWFSLLLSRGSWIWKNYCCSLRNCSWQLAVLLCTRSNKQPLLLTKQRGCREMKPGSRWRDAAITATAGSNTLQSSSAGTLLSAFRFSVLFEMLRGRPGRALPLSGALRCPSAELGARRGAGILGRRSVL